jgi:short-subunit dehydrogenase
MFSMPSTSAYGATKAAVISLGGSLRLELMAAKVGVTTVCPVYVKTPIEDTVQLFGRMDNPRGRKLVAKSFQTTSVTADDVAREALKAINSNKGLVIVGSEGKFLNLIQRLSRGLLEKLIVKATINKFKYFRAVK